MKDKEKQIFDKYGNYNFPTEIKQEGLNSATSQIEEIAKDIHRVCTACSGEMFDEYTCDRCQAKSLIEQGYQKIPKDSVVLTKAEKQKLLKGMHEQGKFDALADLDKDGKVVLSREEICELKCQAEEDFNKAYDLGSKETAEKFVNLPDSDILVVDTKEYGEIEVVSVERLQELAKQFGVEIKE